jgi:hypothetical protein
MSTPNQELELESPEQFAQGLLDSVQQAQDGILKRASDSGSKMVRRRIRENGFGRLILPFKPVVDSDLARLPNTELPVMIEEMEPESVGAKAISFNDTADTQFYRGDKFVVGILEYRDARCRAPGRPGVSRCCI